MATDVVDGHCCFAGCNPCPTCGQCRNMPFACHCGSGGCTTTCVDDLEDTNYRPGIDVVMVNYRTPDDAVGFVGSFFESDPPDTSLWVVNVEPTIQDQYALELALADATGEHGLLTFGENVGYGRACNDAALMGDREVVAFFNADTRLSPGLLTEIHGQMLANPGWGVVSPLQVDDANRVVGAGIYGTNSQPSFDGRWMQVDSGQFAEVRTDCVSVSGSAYFVRRKTWDELATCPIYLDQCPDADGAFLPTPHYYEETWCSYHARAHGWQVVFYGHAKMLHRWHQASPVGGFAESVMPMSQEIFRAACDAHRIDHD